MAMRPIPDAAVELAKSYESLVLYAYDDKQPKRKNWTSEAQVTGVPTIGYGHINGVSKADIITGRKCTKAEAFEWLREDMEEARRKLYAACGADAIAKLNVNQYAALLDLVFNIGATKKMSWAKDVAAGRLENVPDGMRKYVYQGKTYLRGLARRREDEVALWYQGSKKVVPEEKTPPSTVLRVVDTPPAPAAGSKPLVASKTVWVGAAGAATATASTAGQIIEAAKPYREWSDYLGYVCIGLAALVVIATVLVVLFKWLDIKAQRGHTSAGPST